ncbi:MAG: hypothetical protein LBE31_04685 [Deltaproteobacteria bacterium]|nr:hypothetical protein [Deltaproteobacteria bacterium]
MIRQFWVFVLMALVVGLFLANSPQAQAQAQNVRADDNGNSYSLELPELKAFNVTESIAHLKCPNVKLTVNISYPQGTGDDLLDQMSIVQTSMEERAVLANLQKNIGDCPANAKENYEAEYFRNFEAHSASKDVLSVLFTIFESTPGAAHPTTTFESSNYSFSLGRQITLNDIFSDDSSKIQNAWQYVASSWCAYNDYHSLPYFYRYQTDADICAQSETLDLPPGLKLEPGSLKYLGNAFLTTEGLKLILSADDGWSRADGPSTILIDKNKLKDLGADLSFWGGK